VKYFFTGRRVFAQRAKARWANTRQNGLLCALLVVFCLCFGGCAKDVTTPILPAQTPTFSFAAVTPYGNLLAQIAGYLPCAKLVFYPDIYDSHFKGQGIDCEITDSDAIVIVQVYDDPRGVDQSLSYYADVNGRLYEGTDGPIVRKMVRGDNWYALGPPEALAALGASDLANQGPTSDLPSAPSLPQDEMGLDFCQTHVTSLVLESQVSAESYKQARQLYEETIPGTLMFVDSLMAKTGLSPTISEKPTSVDDVAIAQKLAPYANEIRAFCKEATKELK
jgi:hypothetical protein